MGDLTHTVDDFTFPKVFISNASVASKIVQEATRSHAGYWDAIRKIEEHLNGKRPIDPETLKKKNIGWAANWNYGSAHAKVESLVARGVLKIYNSLGISQPVFRQFDPTTDSDSPALALLDDKSMRGVMANILSGVFAEAFESDPRSATMINLLEYCSKVFGLAPIVHDNYDWMGSACHPLEVAFEDQTEPGDYRTWVVFDTIKADALYRLWIDSRSEKIAHTEETKNGGDSDFISEGWNLDGLEEALYHAFNGNLEKDEKDVMLSTWEDVLGRFHGSGPNRMSGAMMVLNTENVRIAKIYRRELDGKLTITYIAYNNTFHARDNVSGGYGRTTGMWQPEHLMYQRTKDIDPNRRIDLIRDSGQTPSKFLQDLRGVGKRLVEEGVRRNRLRNGVENKMQILGQPMFIANNQTTGEAFRMGVGSGFTLIDPNFQPIAQQFSFDLRQHMELLRFNEAEHVRDTEAHDSTLQGRLSSRPNKDEVRAKSAEVSAPMRGKDFVKLGDYSSLFMNMLRNLIDLKGKLKNHDPGYESLTYFWRELINAFKDITTDEGEVMSICKAVVQFQVEPALGDPEAIGQALRMAGNPFEVNRLERQMLLALGFSRREVNRYRPLITERLGNGDDEWMASQENVSFWRTQEVIASKGQNPVVHLTAHYSKGERVVNAVREGEDPVEALKWLANMLAHSERHLQIMSEHPYFSRFFQKFATGYRSLLKIVPNLERVAKERAAALQAQKEGKQGDSGEHQAKIMKAQADIRLKEFAAQKKEERTDHLTEVRRKKDEEMGAFRNRLKEEDHKAKLRRDEEMASLKRQLETLSVAVKQLS